MKLRVREGKIENALDMFEGIEVSLDDAVALREEYQEDPTVLIGDTRSDATRMLLEAVENGDARYIAVFMSVATDAMVQVHLATMMYRHLEDGKVNDESEDDDEFTKMQRELLK